jgi:hypothetical protein
LTRILKIINTNEMAKRKASRSTKSKVVHHTHNDDRSLMLLASAAALIVGFFAIFAYKSQSVMPLPTVTPNPVVTVNLGTQNKSGESGTATLQEVNGKVIVSVSVDGEPTNATQPAHIHVGSCPNPGAVKYPLTSVASGLSSTVLNVTMDELKGMGPLAINVHKSVAQSGVYVACGNISF